MVKIISYLGLIFWAQLSMSSEGGTKLMQANVDIANTISLQNGAKLFINYCVSCHSAEYMRYNRMAKDLGLSDDMVKKNLMFASDKIGDTMTIAMRPDDAEQWFGVRPPDLSVIARSKGVDYLYSFLNGFYVDPSRPTGVNNHYYPNTAMPHVLWELQGLQDNHGDAYQTSSDGEMTPVQYEQATRDLVAFLDYVGEPAKLVRYKIGFWVIAFLLVLFLVACMVKKEYWKDIH
jgi:ubiquinol-cytochrome c reductase cytochrome c1 subunit